ncbi:hypothetical protein GALMADRAFT_1115756 [Galerina marginata CBS 339.88]|uniref:RanBD1 domain-containing protein n=1 Tax=Galerina marginata (strain CBS 339.88) TaxID=685588 RepID=A0A067TF00_GALM3|nr:hypothetical protein GALMADRAFT_1115756 [Galerina marginata CBS 339.88]
MTRVRSEAKHHASWREANKIGPLYASSFVPPSPSSSTNHLFSFGFYPLFIPFYHRSTSELISKPTMFPVNDFNFVVAGIATFAATVGYACTRRLSTSLPAPDADLLRETLSSDWDMIEKTVESFPTDGHQANQEANTSENLKRKIPHDGFDEPEKEELGYPHNLANLYPNKRSRTPTTESEVSIYVLTTGVVAAGSLCFQATTPTITPASTLDSIISQTSDVDVKIPMVSHDPQPIVATPAPEPPRTPSPVAEEVSPRASSPTPAPASPPPIVFATLPTTTPQPKMFREVPSRPVTPKPFASPSGGFAAFAGSTSPFAAFSKPNQFNSTPTRSIWSSGDLTQHQNEGEPAEVLADVFKPLSKNSHAIYEAKATPLHPTEKYTHVTGEEDEDVELEQKGVKLYAKRGDKPFSDGVVGHIKLLSNRSTLEERILFRREPLWKVSMNVRVKPAVRCTYVPEENVLRLILKETVDDSDGPTTEGEAKKEVVIYALKPGRSCSKQDFREFAESLMKSPHFKTPSADPST